MAEIRIQRRRRRSVWPWLLGLLVLALLPLPFIRDRDQQTAAGPVVAQRDTTTQRDTTAQGDTSVLRDTTTAAQPIGPGVAAASRGGQRTTATAAGTIAPPVASSATDTGVASTPAGPAASGSTPEVSTGRGSFARFLASRTPPSSGSAYRAYAADALRQLADELRALGATEEGVSIIRVHADSIQMPSSRSAAHPDYARAAFLGAIREIDLLRSRHRATINMQRLRNAAWAINPRRTLVAQRTTITRFLEAARGAVDSLTRRA